MRIGLVLSGGGGKGAYELGVWKALIELGLDKYVEVFSGTSIGAFNAILFAQDDMNAADELWKEVSMDKLVPISKSQLFIKGIELLIGARYMNIAKKYMLQRLEEGAVPKDGAIDVIEKYLDVKKVKERKKVCYAACTKLPELTPQYFKINDYEDEIAKDIIIASASLPCIYDCTEISGSKYIDGGVSDNTPIQPVYGEGCDVIIVILLSKEGKVDRTLYPNARIIELYPRNLNENVISGTLNLDEEAKKLRIKEGYEDTVNLLKPIMEMANLKSSKEEREEFTWLYKIYTWMKIRVINFRKLKERISKKFKSKKINIKNSNTLET